MRKISKEKIINLVETNYSEQRNKLIEDITIADNCVKIDQPQIPIYEKLKLIVLIEMHMKELLVNTLTELLS